ncbi:hypothetical protein Ccrd_018703 [Cynara cardunculus var. scolymus]|uniref:Uncharacterized protein n=1 Tax=Cynara cardunculus var. scolymus TaxID=59895 RepID=A0A118K1M8_CYNCS|nr:hypothetical protein Ccrd_018703 [Cynara cardunculus var. scolymus]
MEETLVEHTKSLAAPIIFIVVLVFQLFDKSLAHMKKKASMSEKDAQLRAEIKQLLKEAAALSEPSTFAQSAKLKRMAAAKERELAKTGSLLSMVNSHLPQLLYYLATVLARSRVSQQGDKNIIRLVRENSDDFKGRFLSWRTGNSFSDSIMVGVIPWLILSTRVGKYLCSKVLK